MRVKVTYMTTCHVHVHAHVHVHVHAHVHVTCACACAVTEVAAVDDITCRLLQSYKENPIGRTDKTYAETSVTTRKLP